MHFYPFHIGDYRAGTVHLTQLERWVYRDLLDCLYDTEQPLPLDVKKVCMMVGARSDEHKEAVKLLLEEKFEHTDKGYTNFRFEAELDKYRSKAQRAIDANKKRWGYKNDLKSDVKSDTNQIATNNQEPITNKLLAPPDGVPDSVWQDFVKHRKSIKAPLTGTAVKGIEREAKKAGISLNDAIQEICARGWRGFKADWVTAKPESMSTQDLEKALFK